MNDQEQSGGRKKIHGTTTNKSAIVRGKERRVYKSVPGLKCSHCNRDMEEEFYTRSMAGLPICITCQPFKEKEKESMQQSEQDRTGREAEAAYRRGWTQAADETARLVLQLIELGYKPTEIKRLLAVYDDHFLAKWRHEGDLDKREAPPEFNIEECQAILAGTAGYNWIV